MKVRVLAFDGDEMNAHCPQSLEAAVELEDIAAVPNQIITPRHGKPAISIVQDTLLGSYRICRDGVTFNRREFMDLMVHNKRFTGVLPPPRAGTEEAPRWTGQQVLSMLMPPINMEMKNKLYDDQPIPQNFVKIKNGVLEQGIIDKDVYSKPSKGIIHTTYNDYGPQQTVELIDSLQNTVSKFLVLNGFSVGISDLIADEGTRAEMEERIMTKKRQIAEIILQVHLDLFDNNTGNTNQEEFESRVLTALNEATNESGKIGIKSLADDNRLMSMIRSGSKGGPVNVSQMMACVGQQNIENKRIPYGFQDRTLPHYKKYDDSAEARGFIESSFIRGLTPQEFFFHAMSGREGLIDTAVKTADTGYIQRQMVKGMEDLLVQHDGTVRDASMGIVQFAYGEDGINATKIEAMGYPLGKMTRADIDKEFGLEGVDLTPILQEGVERGADKEAIKAYKEQVLEDRRILVEQVFNKGRQGAVYGPVNLERVIDTVKVRFGLQKELEVEGGPKQPVRTDLTPEHVITGINKLIEKTQTFSPLWAGMLRFYLSPYKMIEQHRFTKAAFDTMCEVIITKNWQSWVVPGEQVGILAAQSIGEPSTQMVLNSVDYNERIIISRNGRIITPMIGEFIDNYYESVMDEPGKVQHLANDQIYINLDDGADWKALSTDADGKMQWTRLEAITRHPVINADGTDTILKVTLASGRTVRATKAESFLTVKDGKIETTRGSDLVIGDELPVASTLALDSLGSHSFEDEDLLYSNFFKPLDNNRTFNNTVLDPIVAIEECNPFGRWVYDVTVEGTRNFTLLNALCQRDTFHLAGVASKSNVTGGLPRLKELLKVTQNPKATSLTIFLKKEYRQSKEKAREVSQQLELTMLRDITLSCGIYYDPKDEQSIKEEDRDLLAFYKLYEQGEMAEQGAVVSDSYTPYSPWLLRLELNREKMFDRNISMYDIAFVLRDKFPNCSLVYSDYNAQKLVMRIRVQPTAGLDSIADLKRYQNKLLSGVILRGAIGLKSVAFRKDETVLEEQEGAYAPVTQYILDTDGSNYLEVMNHPAIDGNKLYSTNVHDLYEQYGIEAARVGLIKELTIVFEEAGVNIRHLGLLVDVMTRSGRLMSMDRYGINKRDIGPLAKASFEETGKILLKASLFGEVDPVTGVSANIMTGQPIRGGTAFSQIIMDETSVVNLYKGLPPAPEFDVEEDADLAALAELEDPYGTTSDACSAAKFQMSVTMPPVGAVQDEEDITLNVLSA